MIFFPNHYKAKQFLQKPDVSNLTVDPGLSKAQVKPVPYIRSNSARRKKGTIAIYRKTVRNEEMIHQNLLCPTFAPPPL